MACSQIGKNNAYDIRLLAAYGKYMCLKFLSTSNKNAVVDQFDVKICMYVKLRELVIETSLMNNE